MYYNIVLQTVKSGKFTIGSNAMDVVRRNGVTVSFASDGLSRALQFASEFQLRYFFADYKTN